MSLALRSIQARIAACIAALLLLLCLLAGLAFAASRSLNGEFSRYGDAQSAARQSAAVSEMALLLQLRAVEYAGSETATARMELAAALRELQAAFRGRAAGTVGPMADAAAAVGGLGAVVDEIGDAIARRHATGASVADASAALSGTLAGLMASAARAAAAEIQSGAGVAASSAQRASLFATRYLVSASPADLAAAKSDLSNCALQLAAMDQASEGSQRLRRQVSSAREVASQLTEEVEALGSATDARDARMLRLRSAVSALRSAMEASAAELAAAAAAAEGGMTLGLHRAGIFVAAFAAFAVCLGLICLAAIARTCVRPLGELVMSVRGLAAGALDRGIPHTGRKDEIGDVAGALETLRLGAVAAKEVEEAAARFGARAAAERQRLVGDSADATERALGEIARSVGSTAERLLDAANGLGVIAGRTFARVTGIVAGSTEGRDSAEQVAAEADRLVAQIDAIATRVVDAEAITGEAARHARETAGSVTSLANATDGVEAASRLIAAVANRTKLLALNATMEAARSGSAGRGFAVVAVEIKALAAQTATATAEIERQIRTMRLAVTNSAGRIASIQDTFDSVRQLTEDVADSYREQDLFMRALSTAAAKSALTAGSVATAMESVLHDTSSASSSAEGLRGIAAEVAAQGMTLDSRLVMVVHELRAA